MTREQAINYLRSSGMSDEQIDAVVQAIERTEPQECDCISRQAAIDAMERKKDKNAKGYIGGFYNTIIQNDIDTLMQLPSVQPEIIMCKDCEHWDKSWANDWEPNCHYCPMIDRVCGENWYCADAERRTDENTDMP